MIVAPFTPKLNLVCRKCTRTASFPAPTIKDAATLAVDARWVRQPNGDFICPRCFPYHGGSVAPRSQGSVTPSSEV